MTKNNIYLPKENLAKVETIQELKNEYKIPSYEEFMKTYEPNEEVEILTEAEYQDRLLHGSRFGPGNEQSKNTAKGIGGVALTTLTIICPPAGLAVGAGVAGAGAAVAVAGAACDDPKAVEDGLEIFAMGMGSTVKGATGLSSHKGYVCSLPICPKK